MKYKFIILLLLAIFIMPTTSVLAEENDSVEIYFFVQQGCPHCSKVEKQLEEWKAEKYPEIEVHKFDIVEDKNVELLINALGAYNFQAEGVPLTFIGEEHIVGADLEQIENAILNCRDNFCPKPSEIIQNYADRQAEAASAEQVIIDKQEQKEKNTKVLIILGIIVAAILIFIYTQFIKKK